MKKDIIVWKYGTIKGSDENISQFLSSIYYENIFSWPWSKCETSYEDGINKINNLFELVECKLNIFPNKKVEIILLDDMEELNKYKSQNLRLNSEFPAWINLTESRIYVVVGKVTQRVLRHEFGHFIIESSLNPKENISRDLHELIAKWSETKVK